jgi:hypothetical protein
MKLFNQVKINKPKSSVFDLSHEKKLTCNMGELIPIYLDEILPGDKFKVNTEMLIRFHPMIAPLMHRINATVHYFYVPNRLVFKNWDKFITGGDDGADATPFPQISLDAGRLFGKGTLSDYFGIPTPATGTITLTEKINALPYRAYQLIWNEYYRDQNLQEKVAITDADTCTEGEEAVIINLQKRAWAKDYFTSALPWAQKGGETMIPMTAEYYEQSKVMKQNVHSPADNGTDLSVGAGTYAGQLVGKIQQEGLYIENIEGLNATINDLRTSIRLQEWLEKNARAGSRLFESILVHFGVVSDDLRIGRPQYLGGGRIPVTVSEVLSTFENTETFLGQMGGHGISVGNNANFKGYFKEHGYVFGLLSITPLPSYQNGLHKLWSRADKFDFAWPEFANLGEQEIKNKEIYLDWINNISDNELTFGYTPRYSEYKFGMNTVHGDFKDNLAYWHAGRIFNTRPTLNEDFIVCNTADIDDRIFPVADAQATDKLYVQLYNNVKAVRALPYFGTPRL